MYLKLTFAERLLIWKADYLMRIEMNKLKNDSQIGTSLNEELLFEKVDYLMKQLNELQAAKVEQHNSKIQEDESLE